MDSIEKLASAITLVEEARGVPLSASCVVHRGEMLELLDEARAALPVDFESAQKVIASRDAIIEEGRLSAEQMISMAREDVARHRAAPRGALRLGDRQLLHIRRARLGRHDRWRHGDAGRRLPP